MSKSGQPLGLAGSAVPWPDAQFPSQHCPHRDWGPCVPTASAYQPFPTPNPENVHASKEGGESVGKEGGESVWVEGRTLVCAAESGLEIRG